MAVVALIKYTQGATVGLPGVALAGVALVQVDVENDDPTDVASWKIDLVYVPPGSALALSVLATGDSPTPFASFTPDVPGCYRIVLTVWDSAGMVGNSNVDIRNFGVPDISGIIYPPYQELPRKLPVLGSGGVGEKPDETNFNQQPYGWAGDGTDGLLLDFMRRTSLLLGAVGDWQESVRFVADGDVLQGGIGFTRTGDTYEADGVGVMPAQDGVTPVVGDRFVLDFAAPNVDTGILEVVDIGSGGTTYKWRRAPGLDSTIDPSKPPGLSVRVEEGGSFAGSIFKIVTTGTVTINSDPLDFEMDTEAINTLQEAYSAGQIITVDIPGSGTFLVQNTAAAAGSVMKLAQLSGAGLGGDLLTIEMGAAQTAGVAAFINDLSDYSNVGNSAIALRVRAGSPLQDALRIGTTFEVDPAGTGVQVSLDSQATLLLYSAIAIRLGRTAAAGGAYTVPLMAIGEELTLPNADGNSGDFMTTNGAGVLSWKAGFDPDTILTETDQVGEVLVDVDGNVLVSL